jgi:hypothetical protein
MPVRIPPDMPEDLADDHLGIADANHGCRRDREGDARAAPAVLGDAARGGDVAVRMTASPAARLAGRWKMRSVRQG